MQYEELCMGGSKEIGEGSIGDIVRINKIEGCKESEGGKREKKEVIVKKRIKESKELRKEKSKKRIC